MSFFHLQEQDKARAKRARSPEGEVFDIEGSPPKRRRGAMSAQTKKSRAIERLLRLVNEVEGEDENEVIEEGGSFRREVPTNGAKPDQLRYYKDEQRVIVTDTRDRMRFFLFTVLPFATYESLTIHSKQFFLAACQDRYKSKYKGIFRCFWGFLCVDKLSRALPALHRWNSKTSTCHSFVLYSKVDALAVEG